MKALFVGLGSIGRRHLRNLGALCAGQGLALQAHALRTQAAPLPEAEAALLQAQFAALPEKEHYDVAFITNPTALHAEALATLRGRADCLFIEKPIFEHPGHNLAALGLANGQKAYVAAPMRWCGVYRALRERLAGLPVYSVRVLCSSYLPGWRPGADYRKTYSAQAQQGGGVALDLIHEWDYLLDLFGPPQQCRLMTGRFSDLEISSDDLAVYIARYRDFLCEVHLDYFGQEYRRSVEIFSQQGTLTADFGSGLLTLPDGRREDHAEDANRRYEREMEYFVEYALHGSGESVNSPRNALRTLQIALEGME